MLYNILNKLQNKIIISNFVYMKYIITILVTIGFGTLYCFLGVVGNQFLPEQVAWYSHTSVLTGILAIIFACAIFITSVGIYTEIRQK